MAELSPGSTLRRWEPVEGVRKHNEKIHRESKFADDHKNLPFTFSKPVGNKRHEYFKCVECGHILYAPKNTIMCICHKCKKTTKVIIINN